MEASEAFFSVACSRDLPHLRFGRLQRGFSSSRWSSAAFPDDGDLTPPALTVVFRTPMLELRLV